LGHTRRNSFVIDVRFGSKADIAERPRDVRFTPESGHWAAHPRVVGFLIERPAKFVNEGAGSGAISSAAHWYVTARASRSRRFSGYSAVRSCCSCDARNITARMRATHAPQTRKEMSGCIGPHDALCRLICR
jgi:hypothetical protein